MKAIIITALLASATSLVGAAPAPPTPRPAPPLTTSPGAAVPPAPGVCADIGQIAFEADVRLRDHADPTKLDLTTSTTKLYWTGAWTYVEQKAGKQVRKTDGCLSVTHNRAMRAALDSATWKTHAQRFNCHARSLSETAYSAADKQVFVAEACGSEILDDVSAKALADLNELLDAEINPKMPCCKS